MVGGFFQNGSAFGLDQAANDRDRRPGLRPIGEGTWPDAMPDFSLPIVIYRGLISARPLHVPTISSLLHFMSLRPLLILFAVVLVPFTGRAQGNWRADAQNVTRENLWGISFSGSAFVAVGEKGTILYSDYDGAPWQSRVSGTEAWLVGVGFGNNRWIAVGDAGTILVSDDNGDTWAPRASGTTTRLNNVAYGGGRWLIVGEQGIVLTSTDGNAWTARSVPTSGFLRALAFGQGQFLFGGAAGALYTTTDGATFTRVAISTTANIEAAAITTGRFFVSGSNGLRATATALNAWQIVTSSFAGDGTLRGLAARSDNDASVAGDGAAWSYANGQWNASSLRPAFLTTAMTLGREEAVAVGFAGGVARSSSLYDVALLPRGDGLVVQSNSTASVVYGTDAHLLAVPTGSATSVTYQWQKNAVDLPGATDAELVLRAVKPDAGGSYGVRASAATGTVRSPTVTVQVVPAGRPQAIDSAFNFPFAAAPSSIAPQTDGTILILGPYTGVAGSTQSTVVRLNHDGSIDNTFHVDPSIAVVTMRPAGDGRIYVNGPDSQPGPHLARLLASGAVDPSFAPDPADQFSLVWLTPDGAIYARSRNAPGIVRLTATGARDTSFTPIPSEYSIIGNDAQGRLLARKPGLPGLWFYPATAHRFLANGARDTSYEVDLTNMTPRVVTASGDLYGTRDLYGHFGTGHSFFHALAAGSFDNLYLAPLAASYPDFALELSDYYLPDGSMWDFRREGSAMKARAYTVTGARDATRLLELPDTLTYVPLAVDADGAILALRRASYYTSIGDAAGGNNALLVRLRPSIGRAGRLTNLSVRAFVGSPDAPLIAGFVTAGTGETRALVRGVGPGLVPFSVTDAMPDPQLNIVLDNAAVATNDQWSPDLAARFAALGAFPLTTGSRDAALETTLGAGNYSAIVSPAPGSAAGTALLEVYESVEAAPRRFVNLSARGPVAAGRPLIVGFTITGELPASVLVRGVGPTLGAFGVTGALTDARITLYRGSAALYENDNWSALNPTLTTSNAGTGAFALATLSKDAAMAVTLSPGSYTAVVEGAAGATGTALAEIYELP
jgi:hypothetical protein